VTSVCIVSNELYPIDKGGIGRLMYNFAVHNLKSDRAADLHFLLPSKFVSHAAVVESEFEGLATIHYCGESLDEMGALGSTIRKVGATDALDTPMIESLRYYGGLIAARDRWGSDFDFVEFPDYGGWGTASIAAKRSGLHFHNTRFVVRLHSTFNLIVDHEPFVHEPSEWMAAICDLERTALENADIVIAHLQSTARLNAERFGFSPDWLCKVQVEMPPIVLSAPELDALEERQRSSLAIVPPRNFLFSSRLQTFKRPDTFLRAAVRYLDRNGEVESQFLIASYGWDENYIDWLKRLVPPRWRDNVVFLDALGQHERAELILDSILVIPSDFESLCLLAYEARQLGVKLVLNRHCLAFGAEPAQWRDGQDCLFFDGNFISLADTMERALAWSPAPARPLPPAKLYWERTENEIIPLEPKTPRPLRLGFLFYGSWDLEELGARVQQLRLYGTASKIHVIVPRESFEAAAVPDSAWSSFGIGVHLTSWLEPTPSEIAAAIATLDVEAVAFLPAQMNVERVFWRRAVESLATHPDVGVFTSHLTREGAERPFALYYGDGPNTSLLADRVAHRASVFRRQTLDELGVRELAGDRWHEDLCVRLLQAGQKIIVAPAGMATEFGPRRHSRIQSTCFFATQIDERYRNRDAPPRRASFVKSVDSILSIRHDDWVARQEQVQQNVYTSARVVRQDVVRFDDLELKSKFVDEARAYAELEIIIRGLGIGRMSVSFLGFKLSQYHGQPQLEFRDAGNAAQLFAAWPPSTADEWGPLAVWSPGFRAHPFGIFFERAPEPDLQRLRLLLSHLPAIIAVLPLSHEEQIKWADIARALAPGAEIDRELAKALGF